MIAGSIAVVQIAANTILYMFMSVYGSVSTGAENAKYGYIKEYPWKSLENNWPKSYPKIPTSISGVVH
jgi:hypothetical protein